MPIARISFDTNSSLYLKELVQRQIDFVSRQQIAYRIIVPEDLRWW